MPRCLVALGSNLGDREQNLARAVEMLRTEPGVESLTASGLHETSAVGGPASQGVFLNAAASLVSTLSPYQLHAALARIERVLGRQRGERWAARSIDLDLLLYDSRQIDSAELIVPHPRMAFRRFVLEPAAEVAADMVHPAIGWTIARLLEHLNRAVPYVALLGPPGVGKTALARRLVADFGGRLVADLPQPGDSDDPPDSSGPLYQRQIQFLDRRRRILDRATWPAGETLAVSDFYFDQCVAYALLELDGSDLACFERSWEAAREQIVSPKLLVTMGQGGTGRGAVAEQLSDELARLAARPEIGPVLKIADLEPSAALAEVSAAIQAMQ